MTLGGVIYLHDISEGRTLRTARTNFDMFRKLCGEEAEAAVIIATTKWSEVTPELGERREAKLCDEDWKEIIRLGLGVRRFEDSQQSAQSIVDVILDRVEHKNAVGEVLQIQRELVDLQRYIPETEAGNTLRYTLQQVLEMQGKIVEEIQAQNVARGDSQMLVTLRDNWDQLKKTLKQIKDAILAFRKPTTQAEAAVLRPTVSSFLEHNNNCRAASGTG
jgi:hypothetical protein